MFSCSSKNSWVPSRNCVSRLRLVMLLTLSIRASVAEVGAESEAMHKGVVCTVGDGYEWHSEPVNKAHAMPCSCCSCMLPPGSSVFGAIFLGMWEGSAGVVILGTLEGLQGGHDVCCSAEAQQRAAATTTNEEQRRPWRTPVRGRKAKPIWNRIVGSGSTALARAWRLQGLFGRSRRRLCFETRSTLLHLDPVTSPRHRA
jgi:hypothetical protein